MSLLHAFTLRLPSAMVVGELPAYVLRAGSTPTYAASSSSSARRHMLVARRRRRATSICATSIYEHNEHMWYEHVCALVLRAYVWYAHVVRAYVLCACVCSRATRVPTSVSCRATSICAVVVRAYVWCGGTRHVCALITWSRQNVCCHHLLFDICVLLSSATRHTCAVIIVVAVLPPGVLILLILEYIWRPDTTVCVC